MRKENEESLRRIHMSSETLSVRVENIDRRRKGRYSNSSHEEDKGYEEDEGGRRGVGREEIIKDIEVVKERKGLRE